MIAEDGARAGEVIRRLRTFLKKRSPETTLFDINEVIHEVVALTRVELLKRQVEVRTELSVDLPPVCGDRIQLQQVLLNLIMNSAEAMEATPAPKEIVITSRGLSGVRSWLCEITARASAPRICLGCSMLSLRRSLQAWAWGYRSAIDS